MWPTAHTAAETGVVSSNLAGRDKGCPRSTVGGAFDACAQGVPWPARAERAHGRCTRTRMPDAPDVKSVWAASRLPLPKPELIAPDPAESGKPYRDRSTCKTPEKRAIR